MKYSRQAAEKGIGALAFAFFGPEEARHWVETYFATQDIHLRVGHWTDETLGPFLCACLDATRTASGKVKKFALRDALRSAARSDR